MFPDIPDGNASGKHGHHAMLQAPSNLRDGALAKGALVGMRPHLISDTTVFQASTDIRRGQPVPREGDMRADTGLFAFKGGANRSMQDNYISI